MLTRYVKIRDAIKMVASVEDLLPRPSTHRQIVQLVKKIEDLDSVCVKLQGEERSLADVRLLFDAVMTEYPSMTEQLKPTARVVHSPVFESTVIKILADQALTATEEGTVAPFAVRTSTQPTAPETVDFATATLRNAKRPRHASSTRYIDLLRMIPPTSNRCERLFSQCKLVLTPLR